MPLKPSGNFLSFTAGALQARVYEASGHVELAGPDLSDSPLSNVITFGPLLIATPEGVRELGKVIPRSRSATVWRSSRPLARPR